MTENSGTGTATIDNGGEIDFGAANTAITQNVTFANNGTADATLEFDASASATPTLIYDGLISGFSTTKDRLDFTGLTFEGNTTPATRLVDGNTVLTVTEGADEVSVMLAGNHTGDHFTVARDSGTGTMITDPAVPHGGEVHIANFALFGSYIASFTTSGDGGLTAASMGQTEPPPLLVHPHA